MPKGQVPWPGNSWMLFTFPSCFSGASAATKIFTLQQATHTELTHQYIQYALPTLSFFIKSKWSSLKYCTTTSKRRHWMGHRPHQSNKPPLLIPVATQATSKWQAPLIDSIWRHGKR